MRLVVHEVSRQRDMPILANAKGSARLRRQAARKVVFKMCSSTVSRAAVLVRNLAAAYHRRVLVSAGASRLPVRRRPEVLLLALLLCFSPVSAAPAPPQAGPSAAASPRTSALPVAMAASAASSNSLSVADLVAKRPTEGSFKITGYIAKIYTCPPCPPGAACKPCMGDNVVLCDRKAPIASYDGMAEDALIVFGTGPKLARLRLGKRYRVTIEVRATRHTSAPYNDVWLTHAEPAP